LTNEKFFSSASPQKSDRDMPRFLNSSFCFYLAHRPMLGRRLQHFVLGGPPRRPQYAICLLTRGIALDATP